MCAVNRAASALAICAVLAGGLYPGTAVLSATAEPGPCAYDFTGADALSQPGVGSEGAVLVEAGGVEWKSLYNPADETTEPTGMAPLAESNSARYPAADWAQPDGIDGGSLLGPRETAAAWTEVFWADEGRALAAFDAEIYTAGALVPVLRAEMSAAPDFTDKAAFTASRQEYVRPDGAGSRRFRFTAPPDAAFRPGTRYLRLTVTLEDGGGFSGGQVLAASIRLGLRTESAAVAAGNPDDFAVETFTPELGSIAPRNPVAGNAVSKGYLYDTMAPVPYGITADSDDASRFFMVLDSDREIDRFFVTVGCFVEQTSRFKVYMGRTLEEVTGESYETDAASIRLTETPVRSGQNEDVQHDGVRYGAADMGQLLGRGYTYIRFEMDVEMNGWLSPYITELELGYGEAYAFPDFSGSVGECGGDTLVPGTHNLSVVTSGSLEGGIRVLAGRTGDPAFYGVFAVPEAVRGRLQSIRFLEAYGASNPGAVLRVTRAAALEAAGSVADWETVPLVRPAVARGGADYVGYTASPGDASLADVTYVYFEHPQSARADTLWYEESRGGIRAVLFAAGFAQRRAALTMETPGLRDFDVTAECGGLTPGEALEHLYLEASANGVFTPVEAAWKATAVPGVYRFSPREPLPAGSGRLRVTLRGTPANAQAVRVLRADLFYKGDPCPLRVRTPRPAGGRYTVPPAAGYGESVEIAVRPEEGYKLAALTAVTETGRTLPVEGTAFVMPREPVWIGVAFRRETYALAALPAAHGTVSIPAGAAYGDTVRVEAVPDDGYRLDTVTVQKDDGAAVQVTDASFAMPSGPVTVAVRFKAYELEAGVLASLGASVRLCPEDTGGKRGLRFMAAFFDGGADGRLTVEGRAYTVEAWGFYRIRETDLPHIGNAELGHDALRGDGRYLEELPGGAVIADETAGGNRRVEYAAVLRDITDGDETVRYLARPYMRCRNAAGQAVYFYGETVGMSIREVKTRLKLD